MPIGAARRTRTRLAPKPFPFRGPLIEYTPLSLPGAFPMRLATILTPHGPRAAVATADAYIDLHATDPGLPTCVKSLLAASPAVRKAAAEAAASSARREVRRQRGEAAAAGAEPGQDPLHRPELSRSRHRRRQGNPRRAGGLRQVPQHAHRPR